MINYDCIVVGGGHAGCEASMALAKLGIKVLLISSNVDRIGYLSCNPAIGGLAKGHIVREIDALGGMMGGWSDEGGIQFRILNTGKGPAVRATRAQMDRDEYKKAVQNSMFEQKNLDIWQDNVTEILVENNIVTGVRTMLGKEIKASDVLLTTGTFLNGVMHIGLTQIAGGRFGDTPSLGLSENLQKLGFELGRLKTGTTPRLDGSSIDFSNLEEQPGDTPTPRFSFWQDKPVLKQVSCYISWTNTKTHEIIQGGLERSPLFAGVIKGTGARYCPSIEDKIFRFPERERHHVFLEPEGLNSGEWYTNGVSTSLPLDIQEALLKTIPGLENVRIVRPGYAIEYDFVNPIQLKPSFESKKIEGLWFAGQINGTSGYEEAAGQGLWAGINIACKLGGLEPWLPKRDESYISVLVDDLVTKGTNEPYRMFTSRAEHRLLLRESNADMRLTEKAYKLGLVKDAQWQKFKDKKYNIEALTDWLKNNKLQMHSDTYHEINNKLMELGNPSIDRSLNFAELLKRPHVNLDLILSTCAKNSKYDLPSGINSDVASEVETNIKYEGYLMRQAQHIARTARYENLNLPEDIDYTQVSGLSREIVEKLLKVKPLTIGQASRISGVTPAAINCLEVHLRKSKSF